MLTEHVEMLTRSLLTESVEMLTRSLIVLTRHGVELTGDVLVLTEVLFACSRSMVTVVAS